MATFRCTFRRAIAVTAILIHMLALPTVAWAQGDSGGSDGGKSYVVSYLLFVLVLALGLLLVVRPVGRSPDIKPKD